MSWRVYFAGIKTSVESAKTWILTYSVAVDYEKDLGTLCLERSASTNEVAFNSDTFAADVSAFEPVLQMDNRQAYTVFPEPCPGQSAHKQCLDAAPAHHPPGLVCGHAEPAPRPLPPSVPGSESVLALREAVHAHSALFSLMFAVQGSTYTGSPECLQMPSKVQESHLVFTRCVQLLFVTFSCGGQVSLEQPTNSMAWLEPLASHFLREIQADLVNVAACSVGLNLHKSWLFATCFRPLQALASVCGISGAQGIPQAAF